jgi:hypothetical protein
MASPPEPEADIAVEDHFSLLTVRVPVDLKLLRDQRPGVRERIAEDLALMAFHKVKRTVRDWTEEG